MDKFTSGHDNQRFQIEMENIAGKDDFLSLQQQCFYSPPKLLQPAYIETQTKKPDDPQGSMLSLDAGYLEQRSDILPLTETHSCRYEECMKFHTVRKNDPESPASPLKNAFFYLVLIMLLIWIFVYTVLNRMDYL